MTTTSGLVSSFYHSPPDSRQNGHRSHCGICQHSDASIDVRCEHKTYIKENTGERGWPLAAVRAVCTNRSTICSQDTSTLGTRWSSSTFNSWVQTSHRQNNNNSHAFLSLNSTKQNWTACANFPTGVELAKDRTPEDDSKTKCCTFSFFLSPVTLTFDLDIRTRARFLYNYSSATRGHVANRHISISQLLSLWRHSHYDVSPSARSPVLIMMSFSLWRHSLLSWPRPPLQTYVRTPYRV